MRIARNDKTKLRRLDQTRCVVPERIGDLYRMVHDSARPTAKLAWSNRQQDATKKLAPLSSGRRK